MNDDIQDNDHDTRRTFDHNHQMRHCFGRGRHHRFGGRGGPHHHEGLLHRMSQKWARNVSRHFDEAQSANNGCSPQNTASADASNVNSTNSASSDTIRGTVYCDNTLKSVVNSKPKARFVRDITIPDGSIVAPGTVLVKIWRIRNDGTENWPNDCVVVPAGGDLLTLPDHQTAVESIAAGEESNIAIQLTAPLESGRHVSYFRFQTKDGVNFGHRLWCDIRVAIQDESCDAATTAGWQVVSGILTTSQLEDSESNESIPEVIVLANGDDETNQGIDSAVASVTSSATANARFVEVDDSDITTESIGTDSAVIHADSLSSNPVMDLWVRVYAAELKTLADMGFTDFNAIIPLLREHVPFPASQSPVINAAPNSEGMHHVVMQLLGASQRA